MSDSYIQNLFAERIGGRQYGKSTAIYKFEKIKRAKRAALAANPGAEIIDMGVGEPDEMAFPEVVDEPCTPKRSKPENRGYADNGDAVLKQAAARYLERVCGVAGHRSGDRSSPLHRQQSRPVDPAGRADQSRRLRPDDHAGLSGLRHARQVLRRPGSQSAADRSRTTSCPTWTRFPADVLKQGQGAGDQLSEQSDRRERHAGVLRAKSSSSRRSTTSSSFTMPPTPRWSSKASR